MKLIKKVKAFFVGLFMIVINFTTGLGFYGLGLIAIAIAMYIVGIIYGGFYINIASGFLGAFVFRNILILQTYIKDIFKK